LVLGVVAAQAGCGGNEPRQRADRTLVRFAGTKVPGTLYLMAGQDGLNADLYRARGSLGSVERLTRGGRISWVAAGGGRLVVADARGSGSDRVEELDPAAKRLLPGKLIDSAGQSPQLSRSGKLLYAVPQYTDKGGDAGEKVVEVARDGGKRTALRSPREVTAGWGPRERLAAVFGSSASIVVDPQGPGRTELRSGLRRVTDFETSVDDKVLALAPGLRIAILRAGQRPRVHRTGWGPLAWAPDGRAVLVVRGARVGLMSPDTGSVKEIGRTTGGRVFGAAWEER
jgi:hypothetical protein